MICNDLSSLIGVSCMPFDDAGRIALIETPFRFSDGDAVSIFVEDAGAQVRFFDDGSVAWHMMGRGMDLSTAVRTRPLHRIARTCGVTLTQELEFELWAPRADAPRAFALFVQTMLDTASWERANEGVDLEVAGLLDEVAVLLSRAYPDDELRADVQLQGISGQTYGMDFEIAGRVVLAIKPHTNSVSSAIRKILDVKNRPENARFRFEVVLDDGIDAGLARREGSVIATVADAVMLSAFRTAPRASLH